MSKSMNQESQAEAFEHYRALLFSIAYRMTGNVRDAEDLVQETYLRSQISQGKVIASPKGYLTTILTHLALDYLKSARHAHEQPGGLWFPESALAGESCASPLRDLERQEVLVLAFLHLRELLSPAERAVFLLHEIFAYPFRDIGIMLSKSPEACRQLFHRARQALQDRRPRFEPPRQCQLQQRFLAASQAGDMATLIKLLQQMSSLGQLEVAKRRRLSKQ
ncbi:sigma-70 family RNA polymerase sigma factor [Ktedonosporobacter rubrisoli]|uniref:Sigma-70 family RNA polymerase sigma factor n=1 Tax=Ktedonosporobacter rubrisoli TaxID=2509675 RepID=A0A4P6JZR5_KTERU|nr:sigma-70 family RNA polymerase sigma factor [Ktedonosporobacter rubrisoli]QBD81135.1 sigma-70 family RNA polymerase sigma factor [Ktedonosporobacter rubrisoli]